MEKSKNIYWQIIAVLCGLAASAIGICINSVGVFYSPVSEALNILRGTFALHNTVSTIVAAVVALIVPKILNEKTFKGLLAAGVAMAVGSTALMGMSTNMVQFLILGAIRGIGVGFFGMVTLTTVINSWFVKKHGLATSVVLSFAGVAGALCSPLFTAIIERYGWQYGFYAMALLLLLLCLPSILLRYTLHPKTMGLCAYGEEESTEVKRSSGDNETEVKQKLFSTEVIALVLFAVSITAVTGLPQHFPGYAQTLQLSAATGGLMLSCSMIGNIVSKIIIGFLSDWIGVVKSVCVMLTVNTISMFVLIFVPTSFNVLVGAFLFGFAYSLSSVGTVLLTRHCFGTKRYSQVYPLASFASNVGVAAAVSLIGYIYDFTGTYKTAYWIAIVMQVINVGLVLVLAKKKIKED